MPKERIGLMGGSFNPIHERHVEMAEAAAREQRLNRLIFLPTGNPPHKHEGLADAEDRYEMTRLAVFGRETCSASREEIDREGVIYTVDTLTRLEKQIPGAEWFYIIGEDTLLDLPNWRNTQKVCTLCRFICLHRPGVADEAIGTALEDLRSRYGAQVHLVPASGPDISSTEIRRRVARGQSTEGLLPGAVRAYIDRENLYRL